MRAPRELTLSAVAELVGARLVGDGALPVRGVAPLSEAEGDEVAFLANPRYRKDLEQTRAAAVLVAEPVEGAASAQLVVADPYAAYARLMRHLFERPRKAAGVSPDARVDPGARLGAEPDVAAFVTVGPGTVIGDRATLHPGVRIEADCVLGDDVTLHPNVVVREGCRIGNRVTVHAGTVIGADGFGYATEGGEHKKIPHVGGVVLEDDVELGANVTIDRAVLGDTVVGAGTKIDNLVQVGHNVRLGRGCLIVSQVGISGSTVLGNYVVLGGQVGVAGHLRIGTGARVGAKGGVTKDVPDGQTVSGFPASPHREQLKAQAAMVRLPELRERLGRLERRVQELSGETT
jgi:UDP-3-O-[3-hydroxymyristoyl] glucosamine N-acyltransferase